MSRRILTITANDRPHYLKEVLDSWYEAQSGHYWPTILNVEPVSQEVMDLCRNASFYNHKVVINDSQFGALRNPYVALQRAFDVPGSNFVVLGEDDSIVSPDILNYFTYMSQLYEYDQSVLAVCSFTYESFGKPSEVFKQRYFASVIWGIWRDRWEAWLRDAWPFDYSPAWDQAILDRLHFTSTYCIFPTVSRSQHIGEHGTHMSPADFERLRARSFYQGPRISHFTEYREDT